MENIKHVNCVLQKEQNAGQHEELSSGDHRGVREGGQHRQGLSQGGATLPAARPGEEQRGKEPALCPGLQDAGRRPHPGNGETRTWNTGEKNKFDKPVFYI
jgi:hypothetical protein